ncbi:uncharacterized protein Tco025E_04711, partial [Trypanosoma conorhini]
TPNLPAAACTLPSSTHSLSDSLSPRVWPHAAFSPAPSRVLLLLLLPRSRLRLAAVCAFGRLSPLLSHAVLAAAPSHLSVNAGGIRVDASGVRVSSDDAPNTLVSAR